MSETKGLHEVATSAASESLLPRPQNDASAVPKAASKAVSKAKAASKAKSKAKASPKAKAKVFEPDARGQEAAKAKSKAKAKKKVASGNPSNPIIEQVEEVEANPKQNWLQHDELEVNLDSSLVDDWFPAALTRPPVDPEEERNDAATTIQACVRGWLFRQRACKGLFGSVLKRIVAQSNTKQGKFMRMRVSPDEASDHTEAIVAPRPPRLSQVPKNPTFNPFLSMSQTLSKALFSIGSKKPNSSSTVASE